MNPPVNYESFQLEGVATGTPVVWSWKLPFGWSGRRCHIKVLQLWTTTNQSNTGAVLYATEGFQGQGLRTFYNNSSTPASTELNTLGLFVFDTPDKAGMVYGVELEGTITGDTLTITAKNGADLTALDLSTAKGFIHLQVQYIGSGTQHPINQ